MTVNYRRSVNGSNDQLGRKYLSDSLTPWWGAWSQFNFTQNIAYDNLPSEPGVLARIINASAGGSSAASFTFIGPQNLNGYYMDFCVRKPVGGAGSLFLYASKTPGVFQYYKVFALTANWVKFTVPIPDLSATLQGNQGHTTISQQIRNLDFTANIVGAWQLDISGFNIRRP